MKFKKFLVKILQRKIPLRTGQMEVQGTESRPQILRAAPERLGKELTDR